MWLSPSPDFNVVPRRRGGVWPCEKNATFLFEAACRFISTLRSRVGGLCESQVAVNRRGCVFFARDGKKIDSFRTKCNIRKLILRAVGCFWVGPDEVTRGNSLASVSSMLCNRKVGSMASTHACRLSCVRIATRII